MANPTPDQRLMNALMTFGGTVAEDIALGLVLLREEFKKDGRDVALPFIEAALERALLVATLRNLQVEEERVIARATDAEDLFASAIRSLVAMERSERS